MGLASMEGAQPTASQDGGGGRRGEGGSGGEVGVQTN